MQWLNQRWYPSEASKMGHLREFVDEEICVKSIGVRQVILGLGMIGWHGRGVQNGGNLGEY